MHLRSVQARHWDYYFIDGIRFARSTHLLMFVHFCNRLDQSPPSMNTNILLQSPFDDAFNGHLAPFWTCIVYLGRGKERAKRWVRLRCHERERSRGRERKMVWKRVRVGEGKRRESIERETRVRRGEWKGGSAWKARACFNGTKSISNQNSIRKLQIRYSMPALHLTIRSNKFESDTLEILNVLNLLNSTMSAMQWTIYCENDG